MANTKKLKKDDLIDIMNNTVGTLVYVNPRTQETWRIEGYGTVDQMPYSELITMKASQPKFLYEPWLIILNDEAVEALGLSSLYENIIKPNEIDKFYQMTPNKMKEVLEKAPKDMKLLIGKLTKERVKSGQVNDLFRVRLIEETLNIDILNEE